MTDADNDTPPRSDDKVSSRPDGTQRVIAADALWDDFFDAPGVDMPRREQPEPQAHEKF